MDVRHYRAQVGPSEIYYEVAGRGAPLVLIHGLSGSGRWWGGNTAFLARRYRVHTVDLVGFGRSRCGQPFTLGDAAATVAAWMQQIGIGPAHVIGHSMGGHIAAELAADHPDLVRRLMLVDAAAIPFDFGCVPGPLDALRGLTRVSPGFLGLLLTDAASAGLPTIARAALDLLAADIRPKLRWIRAATLVVWGEQDLLVPLRLGRALARSIPGARLAVFPGTGHSPMIERPETFNGVAANFLRAGVISSDPPRTRRVAVRAVVSS
ncbi:MAG: hypothetical protein RLZZ387_3593 [Chloroflexota bacterium]|jgi:pimeloyl-ACP methyl ester carboxylesterase